VLVDDGIATGATMRAAVDVVRAQQAAAVLVAVPVASTEALTRLRDSVDEVICLLVPRDLVGVGLWYRDFTQTTDDEVAAVLNA
jgi:putative phosphoribosyl transferase